MVGFVPCKRQACVSHFVCENLPWISQSSHSYPLWGEISFKDVQMVWIAFLAGTPLHVYWIVGIGHMVSLTISLCVHLAVGPVCSLLFSAGWVAPMQARPRTHSRDTKTGQTGSAECVCSEILVRSGRSVVVDPLSWFLAALAGAGNGSTYLLTVT